MYVFMYHVVLVNFVELTVYLGISQRVSGMNCGVALSLALLTAVLPATAARPLCLCRHAVKYHARPGHYEC